MGLTKSTMIVDGERSESITNTGKRIQEMIQPHIGLMSNTSTITRAHFARTVMSSSIRTFAMNLHRMEIHGLCAVSWVPFVSWPLYLRCGFEGKHPIFTSSVSVS